jgi:hypothetical protein
MEILSLACVLFAAALAVLALRQMRTLPEGSRARPFTALCVGAAVPLIAFAYWGLYTFAGRQEFDEMDALYPFAGGILGVLLPAVTALTARLASRRSRLKS